MNARAAVLWFHRAFRARGSRARARGQRAYLKSPLRFHGITTPRLRAVVSDFARAHRDLDRHGLLELARALWQTDYHDLRWVGIALLERYQARLSASDLAFVERLLLRSCTWDHVDWLSTKVAAPLVERYPRETRPRLDRWARHRRFWLRRAAMLSLLPAIRRGGGDFARFARFASPLVGEKEFFIRKAIGWVLREASKKRPALAHAFLATHRDRVSGLTLREGAKYLPPAARAELGLPQTTSRADLLSK
jgi:3-methyladenine DNA glycosylase AlkD